METQFCTEIKNVLSAMFPGDADLGVPCISSLSDFDKFIYGNSKIRGIEVIITECPYDTCEEINEYIRRIKKRVGSKNINEFISGCLQYYFGHSEIVEKLTNKKSPLFPNETILEKIDLDLLEPVYERDI